MKIKLLDFKVRNISVQIKVQPQKGEILELYFWFKKIRPKVLKSFAK
jgi:hypothetical protein